MAPPGQEPGPVAPDDEQQQYQDDGHAMDDHLQLPPGIGGKNLALGAGKPAQSTDKEVVS